MSTSDSNIELRRLLEQALRELHERLDNGEIGVVEKLFERYEGIKQNQSVAIELVYAEYVHQHQRGRQVDVEGICHRYPNLADAIRRLVMIDNAVWPGDMTKGADTRPTLVGAFDNEPTETAPNIPDYEILSPISRGAMGVVWKARQQKLNRIVALKMIRVALQANADEIARFRIEGRAVAGFDHPNIVRVFDIGEVDGCPFISQEFVTGGTLKDALRNSNLSIRSIVEIVEKIARAIHFAHQRGIVHRDLKPTNILMTTDSEPKIADFGLAKRLGVDSEYTRTGMMIGTPSYMAPEQVDRKFGDISVATDVYGIGAVLYELLTSQAPFSGESLLTVITKVCYESPQPIRNLAPHVPRDLVAICEACLQKSPTDRYASAVDVADDLHRFLEDRPIRAKRAGTMTRFAKWVRRNPAGSALTFLLVTMAVVGLTTMSYAAYNTASTRARLENEIDLELAQFKPIINLDDPTSRENFETWADNLAQVKQAKTLSLSLNPDNPRHSRIDRLQKQLEQAALIRELYLRLEELRLTHRSIEPTGLDWQNCQEEYRDAFSIIGLNPLNKLQKDLGYGLQRSTPFWLVRAIDDWSYVSRQAMSEGLASHDWRHLNDFANALDDNDERHVIRARNEQAILELVEKAKSGSVTLATRQLLADYLVEMGELETAIEVFEAHYWQATGDFWLNLDLAVLCLQANPPRLNDAIRYGQSACAISPNKAAPYAVIGSAYLAQNRLEDAERLLHQALTIDSSRETIRNRLAIVYLRTRQPDRARAILEQAAQAPDASNPTLYNLGRLYFQFREHDLAKQVFERLVVRKPNRHEYRFQLAMAHMELGQFDDCLAQLDLALKVPSLDAEQTTRTNARIQQVRLLADIAREMPSSVDELEGEIGIDQCIGYAQVSFYQGRLQASLGFYDACLAADEIWDDMPLIEAYQNFNAAIVAAMLAQQADRSDEGTQEHSRLGYLNRALEYLSRGVNLVEQSIESDDDQTVARRVAQNLTGYRNASAFRQLQTSDGLESLQVERPQDWLDIWNRIDRFAPASPDLKLHAVD